jgi:hypothetical protein
MKFRKNTLEKYLFLIQNLSQKTSTYTNLNHISNDYFVGKQYVAKLRDNKYIIIDANGYYNWNKTVNPSVDIVKQMLKELSIEQQRYMQHRKEKSQVKIVFNEPQKKVRKSRKMHQNESFVQPEIKVEEIGLIRKFIKFIW